MRTDHMAAIIAALLLLPLPVRADEPAEACEATVPERDRLELDLGSEFFSGTFQDVTIRRADVEIGLTYFPNGLPLSIGTGIHVGPTFLELDGALADGLGVDARMFHWYNVSVEAEATVAVYHRPRLQFEITAMIETSAFDDEMEFSRGSIATDQGTFDVTPFLDDHVTLRYGWSRLGAGIVAKVPLGKFTPRLGIGFEHMLMRLSAEMDGEGKFVLGHLNPQYSALEKLYEADFTMIRLAPGLAYRYTPATSFSFDGVFMPSSKGPFWGGTLAMHLAF